MQNPSDPMHSDASVPAFGLDIKDVNGWNDAMLHHSGDPQTYIDGTPKGYTGNMDIEKDPEGKTWRERLNLEADEIKRQGIIEARKAEH